MSDETLPLGSLRSLTQTSSEAAFHSLQVTHTSSTAESQTPGNRSPHSIGENQIRFSLPVLVVFH